MLVKFTGKKHEWYYVGNLQELDVNNDRYNVDLLRRNYVDDARTLSFVKSKIPDNYTATIDDIAIKLPKPALVKDKVKFPIYLFGNMIVR